MKRVASKKKGNRFELDIAKTLSSIFELEFRRTPNSGAYTGGKNRSQATLLREDAREILTGDIIAPKGFPFLIECKHYKDRPSFHAMIHNNDTILDSWLNQNESDSAFVDKEPLLFFKLNNKGTFVVVHKDCRFMDKENIEGCNIHYIRYREYMIFSMETWLTVWNTENIKVVMEE